MAKYIKFLFVALFATMTISLTSCSDDDDNDKPSSGNIVGSWQMVSGVADSMGATQYEQFREDGTYYEVGVFDNEMTSLLEGIKYVASKGTWILDGDKIRCTIKEEFPSGSNDDVPYDKYAISIKSISSNEITFEELGMTGKLKRVSDDVVNGYIDLATKGSR